MKQNGTVLLSVVMLLVALFMFTACQKQVGEADSTVYTSNETVLHPSTTPMELVQVEITMDNWQKYFEIKAIDRWGDNGNGEFTAVSQLTGLWVREEYRNRIVNDGDTSILCELTFDHAECKIDVDYQTQTYTWGETVSSQQGCQISERINYFARYPNGELMVFGTSNTVEKGHTEGQWNENMELTFIEGVFYLAAE